MSYLALNAAPINFKKTHNISEKRKMNKINKRKLKAKSIMEKIGYQPMGESDELANFDPPPPPSNDTNMPDDVESKSTNSDNSDYIEAFNNIEQNAETDDDYYKKLLPYYNVMNSDRENNSGLGEKLDYLIYLLEEQKDEKSENVTEEVILYSFLGVFIIFVLDSFARAGKYVR